MLDHDKLVSHLKVFPRQTIPVDELRPAAVLLPLFERSCEDYLLFTERTPHLQHHAGEISFPGGSFEDTDSDLVTTALRETREELGISGEEIHILGRLDDFYSVHGYHVIPYVGIIPAPDNLRHDPFEIAATFEAPVEYFLDPSIHRVENWSHRGRSHKVDFYQYEEHVIWGLTAAILRQFLEITFELR